jgi:alpha-tubulin suppressor-like RCC1 family protein
MLSAQDGARLDATLEIPSTMDGTMIERPLRRLAGKAALLGFAALFAVACGDGGTEPTIATLQVVGEANRQLPVGSVETVQFRAVDVNGNGVSGVSVSFAPSAGTTTPTQATTAADGLVTTQWTLATTAGEQTLTATAGGLTAIVRVTAVAGAATTVTVTPATLSFATLGDEQQLTAQVRDAQGNVIPDAPVTWSSDDTSVATVSGGNVTAVGQGSTTIRAASGSVVGTVGVSVQQAAAQVTIAPTDPEIRALGWTRQLHAEARDAAGSLIPGAEVDWSTLNAAVAGVSPDGLVEARTEGTARIVASVGAAADTIEITVRQVAAQVVVDPADANITIGQTQPFAAQAVDSAGVTIGRATFLWASSAQSVATVDAGGMATGVAGGIATISATFEGVAGTARLAVDIDLAPLLVAAGAHHSLFLDGSANIWGMGDQRRGQLTGWDSNPQVTPAQLAAMNFVQLDAGDFHSVALRADGTVWTWGLNSDLQLGYTTTEECDQGFGTNPMVPCSTVPRQVSLPMPATKVAAGREFTLVLLSDSTVWGWGKNYWGQLGLNQPYMSPPVPTPTQVHNITDVVDIDGGGQFSVAATADGRMWAWGGGTSGQLCDGSSVNRMAPVQVAVIRDVVAVSAGWFTSRALRRDGTVWGCGSNNFGQVGSGSTEGTVYIMQQTVGLTGVVGLGSGGYHGIALLDDGTVWTWGRHANQSLGWDPGATISRVPGQVPVSGIVSIAGGQGHTVVMDEDGGIWTWGYNLSGQLGDGTQTDRLPPQRVWP